MPDELVPAAVLVMVIIMVMVMLASMPSIIVMADPAVPLVVIVPVVVPEPMDVPVAGIVDISRPVPAAIEHRVQVVEAIPRPGANEHAVDKILRRPVTVRSTTKRIIGVVSVRARRWNVVVAIVRTDLDTDRNLGLRRRCRQRNEYNQQGQIFEMSHDHLPAADHLCDWRPEVHSFYTGENLSMLTTPKYPKSSAESTT